MAIRHGMPSRTFTVARESVLDAEGATDFEGDAEIVVVPEGFRN
jgi:hypothetical protein